MTTHQVGIRRTAWGLVAIGALIAGAVGGPASAAEARIDPNAPYLQCADSALRTSVQQDPKSSGAGQRYAYVDFTNIGRTTCHLRGAPGVSLVGRGDGTQLGRPADREQSGVPFEVQLAPGQTARAPLHFANVDEGGDPFGSICRAERADGYRVYPPHSFRSVYVRSPQWACTDSSVHWGDVGYVDVGNVGGTSAGCSAKGAVPVGAQVSPIADVDGDGAGDAQFYGAGDGRFVYGIRTASGAIASVTDTLRGIRPHSGWTAELGASGVVSVIDDQRTAKLYAFRDCQLVPVQRTGGTAYLFTLAGTSRSGTGVACSTGSGDRRLERSTAVQRRNGRYDVLRSVVQVDRDGGTAEQRGRTEVRYRNLKRSDPRVRQAVGSFCSLAPKVEASQE